MLYLYKNVFDIFPGKDIRWFPFTLCKGLDILYAYSAWYLLYLCRGYIHWIGEVKGVKTVLAL